MEWVPIGAWIAAAVIAVVVLGYCAFEIRWKARRLQRDLARLTTVQATLAALQADLDVTRRRIDAARIS